MYNDERNVHLLGDNDNSWFSVLPPTTNWTSHQIGWIALQILVNTVVCFFFAFALCTVAYKGNGSPHTFGKLDENPVSGSFALTIVLQTLLNWTIGGTMMTLDVMKGRVAPRSREGVSWWPEESNAMHEYLILSGVFVTPSGDQATSFGARLVLHVRRVWPWMLYGLIFVLPLFTGFSYAVWERSGYGDFPTPEILTGCVGIFLVWTTTPLWAMCVLLYMGEQSVKQIGSGGNCVKYGE